MNVELKTVTPTDEEPIVIRDPNRIDLFVAELLERGRGGAIIRLPALGCLVEFLERESYVRAGELDFTTHFAGDRYRYLS